MACYVLRCIEGNHNKSGASSNVTATQTDTHTTHTHTRGYCTTLCRMTRGCQKRKSTHKAAQMRIWQKTDWRNQPAYIIHRVVLRR